MKKKMTRREKVVGWLSGQLLRWLANRARLRGDTHEFAHCNLALLVGNSTHSDPTTECLNSEVLDVLRDGLKRAS